MTHPAAHAPDHQTSQGDLRKEGQGTVLSVRKAAHHPLLLARGPCKLPRGPLGVVFPGARPYPP